MRVFQRILVLLLISIPGGAQIGAKAQQQGKIYGIWQNNQFNYQMTLMLNSDGSGEFDGESIKFKTQGNSLSITIGNTTTDYNYALQGNSMTLSGGDLDGQVVFTRNGTSTDPRVVSGANPSNKGAAYSNTSSALVGLWSGNGEMIEFRAEGKCVYQGSTYPYQISQGHVILTTNQGNVIFGYTVNNRQLTLTANGQQFVYTKPEGAMAGVQNSQESTGDKGGVAMELVGEWCFMNMNTNSQTRRCITLNANGTYVYSTESSRSVNTSEVYGGTASQGGDQGTWYVQGDRIYYNSQSQGQASYRLEKRNHPKNVNDAMIVLDGEPFVTTTLRPPWR